MKLGILLSLLACGTVLAADARMTPEERTNALRWLEESRREFLAAIDGLTDEQWKWKPAPDRWSVGEVAEHVILAEAGQFATVNKAIASAPDPAWETKTKGKTETLVRVLAPRVGRAQAAEAIVPRGGLTPAEVKQRFEDQRALIVKLPPIRTYL